MTLRTSLRLAQIAGLAGLIAFTAGAQSRRRDLSSSPSVGAIETGLRDGHWFAAVKVSVPGSAAALQLLVEDLALPQGASLSLYQVDALGARANVAATYTGSGPLGGTFWTDPVKGDSAIVEVLYDAIVSADLPLKLAEVRGLSLEELSTVSSAALSSSPRASAPDEGQTGLAHYRGAVVPFAIRDGWAVFEGDILLGSGDDLQLATGKDEARSAMGITSTTYRWTGGVVPYVIDSNMPSQYRITDAIAHWNSKLAGTIQLVPRTSESLYVRFVNYSNASTCSSYVGRIGMSGQPINVGAYCSTGNVIHEIGHTVGLYHEHTREDRDNYVQIMWSNIDSGATSNFNQAISSSDDLGPYDYGSIMHYPATGFSINGSPTIVTIPAGIPIGQRSGLSGGDIDGVLTMYGGSALPPPPSPAPPSTVTVTFASNPAGRSLVVDGATVTAPSTLTWNVGSQHTVSAPSASSGNTRYNFASWSDGGSQTHNITAPSSSINYTATFTVQHKVTAASSNSSLGAVSLSPSSADSYYNQGTSVTVSATSEGSGCLTGWSGVTAPASSPIQLSATQPYGITANFQSGALTVSPDSVAIPPGGGTFTLNVTANTGCSWTAASDAKWIDFSSRSGTGSGVVRFSVSRRNAKTGRMAAIQIGDAVVYVGQEGR